MTDENRVFYLALTFLIPPFGAPAAICPEFSLRVDTVAAACGYDLVNHRNAFILPCNSG